MRHIPVAVLGFAVLAALAEPPVDPQHAAGATSSQYGAPSSQYGVPNGSRRPKPSAQYGVPSGGYDEDSGEPANYEFKYDVEDQQFGVKFGHQETRQGEVAQGEYYVMLPDGRTQRVVYTADQDGYHPRITYEDGGGQGYGRGQGGYK